MTKIKEKIQKFQEEVKKKNHDFFVETIGFLFKEYPVLKNFSWRQATPYFNDGDACVFRVHDWTFTINNGLPEEVNDDSSYEFEEAAKKVKKDPQYIDTIRTEIARLHRAKLAAATSEDYTLAEKLKNDIQNLEKEIENSKIGVQLLEAWNAAKEAFSAFEDEILLSLFGDHAEITVHPDRIQIDQYRDHD